VEERKMSGKQNNAAEPSPRSKILVIAAALIVMFLTSALITRAQNARPGAKQVQAHAAGLDAPLFHDYKGIQIGISATVVHEKLGAPKDPSDTQDYYIFSEHEMLQVFYDEAHTVMAFSVTFVGDKDDVPTCAAVLGSQLEPGADGNIYKMVRYAQAGYWVSYNRISGESPVTTITVQRLK
jgi:hypothetical protein